jgi:hypothetical protein
MPSASTRVVSDLDLIESLTPADHREQRRRREIEPLVESF